MPLRRGALPRQEPAVPHRGMPLQVLPAPHRERVRRRGLLQEDGFRAHARQPQVLRAPFRRERPVAANGVLPELRHYRHLDPGAVPRRARRGRRQLRRPELDQGRAPHLDALEATLGSDPARDREARKVGVSAGQTEMTRSAVLAAALALAACAGKGVDPIPANTAPLPEKVQVTPLPDNLPPSAAALSGSWAGRWQDTQDYRIGIDHRLVVETFNGDNVYLIYAWGDQVRGPGPGYVYLIGKLDDGGAVRVDLNNGAQVV